jgi:hypothetical protein
MDGRHTLFGLNGVGGGALNIGLVLLTGSHAMQRVGAMQLRLRDTFIGFVFASSWHLVTVHNTTSLFYVAKPLVRRKF